MWWDVLEIDFGDGYLTLWMQLMPLNCTLKIANFMLHKFYQNFLNGRKKSCSVVCKISFKGAGGQTLLTHSVLPLPYVSFCIDLELSFRGWPDDLLLEDDKYMFKVSENKIKLEKPGFIIALWSHPLRWLWLCPKLLSHNKNRLLNVFHLFNFSRWAYSWF